MNFLSMKSVKLNKKIGFTLAEVLITLAVIGVVAALTIPTLAKKYQNAQYVSALKKAYTQMNQVFLRMAVDSGQSDSIQSYFDFITDTNTSFKASGDAIASYYKVGKNCGVNTSRGCFPKFNTYYDGTSGTSFDLDNSSNWYKFISTDGMSFIFRFSNESVGSANCQRSYNSDTSSPMNNSCGNLYIDVNGLQKPNFLGRDVFEFYITSNKVPILYPYGGKEYDYWNQGNSNFCSSISTGSGKSGDYCSGRIIEKGWIMDY